MIKCTTLVNLDEFLNCKFVGVIIFGAQYKKKVFICL